LPAGNNIQFFPPSLDLPDWSFAGANQFMTATMVAGLAEAQSADQPIWIAMALFGP
jgi:hypothetical protein